MRIDDELRDRLMQDPFEPFRVKLVNGDVYDVPDPGALVIQSGTGNLSDPRGTVLIASRDMHWVVFPIDKINSVESLVSDFQGEAQSTE